MNAVLELTMNHPTMKKYGTVLALCFVACSEPDPTFSPLTALPEASPEDPGSPTTLPEREPGDGSPPAMAPLEGETDTPVGPDPDDGDPAPVDTTPPSVVEVSPPSGEVGVPSDAVIVITFSEAMDRAATEAAYTSEDLPADAVTFAWNGASTELTITPNAPLELATGTDPELVPAKEFAYELSEGARDRAGNPLAPARFGFSTLRRIEQLFPAVQDRDLTGNFRSNGSYGNGDCARNASTAVCVGDSGQPANVQYKGFLSFELEPFALGEGQLVSALLSLELTAVEGNPFGGLGNLILEHVSFDEIDDDAFEDEPLAVVGGIAQQAAPGAVLQGDVRSFVEADLAEERSTQFRLRFSQATDGDGDTDIVVSDWSTQSLRLTFLLP